MLPQFVIFVVLKISLSNSYPLEENDSTTPDFTTTKPQIFDSVIEIQDVWRLTALKDEIALVDSNKGNSIGMLEAKSYYTSPVVKLTAGFYWKDFGRDLLLLTIQLFVLLNSNQ